MMFTLMSSLALAGDPCADQVKVDALQEELRIEWEADRKDHGTYRDPGKLERLDKSRSALGYKLHKSGKLCNAQSKFYAAALMTRSESKKVLDAA